MGHYVQKRQDQQSVSLISKFNQQTFIDLWFNNKVCCLTSNSYKYPEKQCNLMENKNTDFVTLTTSDLEDQSENVFTTFIVNP